VGGEHELHNIDVTRFILRTLGKPDSLIRHVADRPGHDLRYALTNDKIRAELGWTPQHTFEEAMQETVNWYRQNEWWWRKIKTGEYLEYYKAQYAERLAGAQPK
jgi:dTDP-glucose 4,6-dehydratase